jgi:hypothetical protein
MSIKVRKFYVVALPVTLLCLISICALASCFGPKSRLTRQQVVAFIAYSGVPYLDQYLEQSGKEPTNAQATAGGDWNAVFGEDKVWTVTGQVTVRYPDGDKTCSTTWTLSEADGKIELKEFTCQ